MTRPWTASITAAWGNPWLRTGLTALYYLGVLAGLAILYGKGNFSTPPFIYQGF